MFSGVPFNKANKIFAKFCDIKDLQLPHRNGMSYDAYCKALDELNVKTESYRKPLLIINIACCVVNIFLLILLLSK
jgi:hypothetical protein